MPKTMTSREFNHDTGGAKRAANSGPVFITDRGELAYVLLSMEDYRKMARKEMSLFDAISDPRPEADFEFDPPRFKGFSIKPADLE